MGNKGQTKIGDYLAWGILAGILLWLILKMTGVINTPLLIEYSPVFGAVYLAGWAMHKLDRATDDIKTMNGNIGTITEDVKTLKNKTGAIEQDIEKIRVNCPAFLKKR